MKVRMEADGMGKGSDRDCGIFRIFGIFSGGKRYCCSRAIRWRMRDRHVAQDETVRRHVQYKRDMLY